MNFETISITSEPVLTFGLILIIILIVPLFFQKIRLPGIVGLILTGALVGPKGFDIIEASGVIDVLGKVGLLYLMFLAGLEINMDRLKSEKKNTFVFGFLTFMIPQVTGTIIFYSMGYSMPASLLIASMFASHTLVGYPIITRLGISKDTSVTTTVGGTIITDTAALLVLAIIARYVEGNLGVVFWLTFTGLFIAYLAFMLVILPKISYRFFRFMGEKGRSTYVYVIGIMLLCSWLAELIGVEAIIGAFLAGLAFNRLLTNKGPLKNRVEFFGDAFFIPLFLIYVGMQVEFAVLASSLNTWIIMGIMTVTVLGTKYLAAFSAAKILKFNNAQGWVMFGLSQSQAAATLAAVFVGMEIGLIGDEVLNGAIMMILVTCIIGPILVDRYGSKLIQSFDEEGLVGKPISTQHILVPIANPGTTARLIEFASNIRSSDQAIIHPLAVINTFVDSTGQREHANKLLDLASGHIHAVNCQAEAVIETNLNIAEGIQTAIERHSITDIVIGWNGKISTTVKVFGSVLDQLLQTSKKRVFVCKLDQPVPTFKRIDLIISPSMITNPSFLPTLRALVRLAENTNNQLFIHHIDSEKAQIERQLSFIEPDVEIQFVGFELFDKIIESVISSPGNESLLIVTNKRANNYGWSYGINMVPRLMAQRRPDKSFAIVYPDDIDDSTYTGDIIFSN